MNVILKYTLIFITVGLASCSDWLGLKPSSGIIQDSYWQSKEQVEQVLNASYKRMAQNNYMLFWQGELRGDLVSFINTSGGEVGIKNGRLFPNNGYTKWSTYYQGINYANLVMTYAPKVIDRDPTFKETLLSIYMKEALFMRSLNYFYLVRAYGEVPYITQPYDVEREFYIAKSDGDSILNVVKEDLKQAIKVQIPNYLTDQENVTRVTTDAYYMLIADICLWLFDYEEALTYLNLIDDQDRFMLYESAWFENFYPGESKESIFELYLSDDEVNNDIYNKNYVPSEYAFELFFTDGIANGTREAYTIYKNSMWKYKGINDETLRSAGELASCNFIIYRMAEVYLMRAEAYAQLEQYGLALDQVNMVRERAGAVVYNGSDIPQDKVAYEDMILEERALEMAFEGKRWFDLMRMGRRNDYARKSDLVSILLESVTVNDRPLYTLKFSDPNSWYLPIHQDELTLNPELVQNAYYESY